MKDEELIERARAAVDREVEGLDAATRTRLSAARRTALAELEGPGRRFAPGWAPVGAAAAIAAIAIGMALSARSPVLAPEVAGAPGAELEALLSEDDPALYDEDIEFYAWLDEQALAERPDAG